MRIDDIYEQNKQTFSIEVFPPKTGGSVNSLLKTVENLNGFKPAYVSVTYGALGSARGGTFELASKIKQDYSLETMAHFTTIGKTKKQLESFIYGSSFLEVENIMALRGDRLKISQAGFLGTAASWLTELLTPGEKRHKYAYQLVSQIRGMNEGNYIHGKGQPTNFCIGVACYPEGHKNNPRKDREALHLKTKQDAGANFAITQVFFDNKKYFKYLEDTEKAGVTMPIVPGIMPIRSPDSVKFFEKNFGTKIPNSLEEQLLRNEDNKAALRQIGIDYAVKQCQELREQGVQYIHFYTMNQSDLIKDIMKQL